jgi:hypothetical protein
VGWLKKQGLFDNFSLLQSQQLSFILVVQIFSDWLALST